MRVFVIGTGRCGTLTFAMACKHIANYTSSMEQHGIRTPDYSERVDPAYPGNHIEVNSRLVRCLFPVLDKYPNAIWVQLLREREACIESLVNYGIANMHAGFAFGIDRSVKGVQLTREMMLKSAAMLYDHAVRLIEECVPVQMVIRTESMESSWDEFCRLIDARGDLEAGRRALRRKWHQMTPALNIWTK